MSTRHPLVFLSLFIAILPVVYGEIAERPESKKTATKEERQTPAKNAWQVTPSPFQLHEGFLVSGYGSYLLDRIMHTNSEGLFALSGGVTGFYYFSPLLGVAFDTQVLNRGFSLLGSTSRVAYLDFAGALSVNVGPHLIFLTSRNELLVGPFFGIPLGNFSGPASLAFSNHALSTVGVFFADQQQWPLTDDFAIGIRFWMKLALSSVVPNVSYLVSPFDLGMGLVLSFLK